VVEFLIDVGHLVLMVAHHLRNGAVIAAAARFGMNRVCVGRLTRSGPAMRSFFLDAPAR